MDKGLLVVERLYISNEYDNSQPRTDPERPAATCDILGFRHEKDVTALDMAVTISETTVTKPGRTVTALGNSVT